MFEDWLVCAIAIFAVGTVIFLATRPRRDRDAYHQRLRVEPRADFNTRENLADGETHPRWKDHPTERAVRTIRLTARQLERLNIQRKLSKRQPLTRGGFTHGIAAAPPERSQSTNDLLFWLMIYESSQPGHYSPRCAIDAGITVEPDKPFNGLGGSYGGAGATGKWDEPERVVSSEDRQTFTVPDGHVAVRDHEGRATGEIVAVASNALPDRDPPGYMPPSDTGYVETERGTAGLTTPIEPPAPAPSYSAPDPSPSYSPPDTSSSYSSSSPSFDSSPSPSVDTSSF